MYGYRADMWRVEEYFSGLRVLTLVSVSAHCGFTRRVVFELVRRWNTQNS